MTKEKTSITIDTQLWKDWQLFVLNKTGKSRKGSEEIENALRQYMKNNT